MLHNLGIHIIQFPSGKFGFVGSIPATLLGWRQLTASDAMGGRVNFDTGLAHYSLTFETRAAAVAFAVTQGFSL